MMAVFERLKPLGNGASLEEMGHEEVSLDTYSLAVL